MRKRNYENKDKKKSTFSKECEKEKLGKITVYAFKDSLDGEKLENIKINLYRINGISPHLERSCYTNKLGKVEFLNIDNGNYRVIEIIDKSKYDKPVYIRWNEINITNNYTEETIYIINKEKKTYKS